MPHPKLFFFKINASLSNRMTNPMTYTAVVPVGAERKLQWLILWHTINITNGIQWLMLMPGGSSAEELLRQFHCTMVGRNVLQYCASMVTRLL